MIYEPGTHTTLVSNAREARTRIKALRTTKYPIEILLLFGPAHETKAGETYTGSKL